MDLLKLLSNALALAHTKSTLGMVPMGLVDKNAQRKTIFRFTQVALLLCGVVSSFTPCALYVSLHKQHSQCTRLPKGDQKCMDS